jgi:hypothetical protein
MPSAYQRSFFFAKWRHVDQDAIHWTGKSYLPTFEKAYVILTEAERHLEACGFPFEQTEGWGFFFGQRSRGRRINFAMSGDGHMAMKTQAMKEAEDTTFRYKFTWIETGHEKGWVTHYRPKHPPLSSELESVLNFLGLHQFAECPEYDFESCHWRSIGFQQRGDSPFDSNAEFAHRMFDAHAGNFSPGIEKLLAAQAGVEQVGLSFLPFSPPAKRLEVDLERRTARPIAQMRRQGRSAPAAFDVAISFAGSERKYAEHLATRLEDVGYSVFYDEFFPALGQEPCGYVR